MTWLERPAGTTTSRLLARVGRMRSSTPALRSLDRVAVPAARWSSFAVARGRLAASRHRAWEAAPPVFVIGCGRSGTSVLADMIGRHPAAFLQYEPHPTWAVIDRRSDFLGWYRPRGPAVFMDEADCSAAARRRFVALLHPPAGRVLVEKSPINTFRIGYLLALHPDARIVHIRRDGPEVVRSIAAIASRNRRLAGSSRYNDWWGADDLKWRLLAAEGARRGYLPEVASGLRTPEDRAAYEWLASLAEIDRWRPQLGDTLLELTYGDLVADPRTAATALASFLAIDADPAWVAAAAGGIRQRSAKQVSVELGPAITEPFEERRRRAR